MSSTQVIEPINSINYYPQETSTSASIVFYSDQDRSITSLFWVFLENIKQFSNYFLISLFSLGITLTLLGNFFGGISLLAMSSLGLLKDYYPQHQNIPALCGILNGPQPKSTQDNNCWANSLAQYFSMSHAFTMVVDLLPYDHELVELKNLVAQFKQDQSQENPHSGINPGLFLRTQLKNIYSLDKQEDPMDGFNYICEELQKFLLNYLNTHQDNTGQLDGYRDLFSKLIETKYLTSTENNDDKVTLSHDFQELFPCIPIYPNSAPSLEIALDTMWSKESGKNHENIKQQRNGKSVKFKVENVQRTYTKIPKELHIQIRRFEFIDGIENKITSEFCLPDSLKDHMLDTIICHLGENATNGHYITYKYLTQESYQATFKSNIPQNFQKGWYKCNDASATYLSTEQHREEFFINKNYNAYFCHYSLQQD